MIVYLDIFMKFWSITMITYRSRKTYPITIEHFYEPTK